MTYRFKTKDKNGKLAILVSSLTFLLYNEEIEKYVDPNQFLSVAPLSFILQAREMRCFSAFSLAAFSLACFSLIPGKL
jgi:hypothetical protein